MQIDAFLSGNYAIKKFTIKIMVMIDQRNLSI